MDLLQKHFDTALENPDGIKKLRELILTLALQGKLVKQDPNDQPAIELLKEIQAEKKRLIKEGKIKKQKELPPIKPEEVPYEVPEGWVWTRLGVVYSFEYGENLPSEKRSNSGEYPVYGSNGIVGSHDKAIINSKCIVIGRKGSAGAINISLAHGCWVTDVSFYCIPPKIVDFYFTHYLLKYLKLDELGKGIKPGLNRNEAYVLVVPLPPLAEQKRIVTKIDELMVLCDKLEEQRKAQSDKRLAVHTSIINRLLSASDKNDFDTSWRFVARHFDPIYSVKENVAELKKAILTLAMQGKLVKQDPHDQPASELLKEIQAEKKQLIKKGKIKKQKEFPPIKLEEVPYEVPEGWVWTRLGYVTQINGGFAFKSSAYVNEGVRVIRISDFDEQGFKNDKIVRYAFSDKLNEYILEENNILMAMTGGTVGKSILVNNLPEKMVVNQRVATIKIGSGVLPSFINSLIQTNLIQSVIQNAKNSTNDNISMSDITGFLVPLPPLAEQKRIVAKIDELMILCDKLENLIDQAVEKQTALFDAVLAKV